MPDVTHRRFSVFDALILIAATTIGLAWWRTLKSPEHPSILGDVFLDPRSFAVSVQGKPRRALLPLLEIHPIAVAWTLAALLLRLFHPRPSLRRIARQPGFVAECAVLVALAVAIGEFAGWRIDGCGFRYFMILTLRGQILREMLMYALPFEDTIQQIASAVASVWGVMFLARALRPERSWIDRLGRSLGILWLVMYLIRIVTIESAS